jgi:predicted lipoprotein
VAFYVLKCIYRALIFVDHEKNKSNCTIELSFFFISCRDNDESDDDSPEDVTFSIKALLSQSADNYIIPAYDDCLAEVSDLKIKTEGFVEEPSPEKLVLIQEAYRTAFIKWQRAVPFNFGPATKNSFATIFEDINTFPVDESKTEQYILDGNVAFTANFDRDTRGFSTLGYLLFNGDASSIVASYDEKRKVYLTAVVQDIYDRIANTRSLWEVDFEGKGPYRDLFVMDSADTKGSSISLLYNQFLRGYENIKNYKLALPAGEAAGAETPDAKLLEAYYDKDLSKELIIENFEVIKDIWYGKGLDGVDGIGFEEWVKSSGEDDLAGSTIAAFASINDKINTIEEASMEDAISQDINSVKDVVVEFQKSTRYIKSDLSPIIKLEITFNSGDGD